MQVIDSVFYIAIVIMSVVIHEISHGFVADYFGDRTARFAGRLTLNPIKHLDLFGSIILPFLLFITLGFPFGWAKPVPYNPENLNNKKWGTVAVASAGVISNLFIAVIFGIIIHFGPFLGFPVDSSNISPFYKITSDIVLVNLALMIFNLVPIPPLDGSKIVFELLPRNFRPIIDFLEQYALIVLFIFVIFFSDYLLPILVFLYKILTGFSL